VSAKASAAASAVQATNDQVVEDDDDDDSFDEDQKEDRGEDESFSERDEVGADESDSGETLLARASQLQMSRQKTVDPSKMGAMHGKNSSGKLIEGLTL